MKKRMLICHWNMVIGGIETALLNLLKRIDFNQFEIDLLLEDKRGEFLEYIPSYVNVFDSASIGLIHGGTKKALKYELKKFKLISALKICYYRLKDDMRRFDCFYKDVQPLKYDVAICYSMHSIGLMQLINKYVEAPVKLVFIHNEPVKNNPRPGTVYMHDRIKCIDNYTSIISVSYAIQDDFKKLFPQYADRCQTIYNFIDIEKIRHSADEKIFDDIATQKVKILSVGRFTAQKNFTIIPAVCEELMKRNLQFKWYIVGDGDEKEIVKKMIKEKSLQNHLILLGAKTNPYPYFKMTDIYCQPSLSEAYCITVCEARIFNKIVVATDFLGAKEQLNNGKGGFIVDSTPQAIATNIIKILEMNEEEKQKMLFFSRYPNELEISSENRFFELIGQK